MLFYVECNVRITVVLVLDNISITRSTYVRVTLAGREVAISSANFRKDVGANSRFPISIRGPLGGSVSVPGLLKY